MNAISDPAIIRVLNENGGESELYPGSADLVERNLNRRVEVLCPVASAEMKTQLRNVLAAYLRDNSRAHRLLPDGTISR